MNTKNIGDITEFKVIVKLLEMGCLISRPISENFPYDLIIDNGKYLSRIQIKTGRYNKEKGKIVASLATTYKVEGKCVYTKCQEHCEAFVIYCPQLDKFYMVPTNIELPNRVITLRVDETKSKRKEPSIRWAIDYEF